MITYNDIVANAQKNMNGKCKCCNICDGVACRGINPGPGAKGSGDSFTRCYKKLQEIKIITNTIYKSEAITTTCSAFGKVLRYPIMAAPIGSLDLYYGDYYNDKRYAMDLLLGCRNAGIAGFTGDGIKPNIYYDPMDAIKASGCGIPTFKPRTFEDAAVRIRTAEDHGAIAVAMDIDALGISALRNLNPPVVSKTQEELAEIIAITKLPVIIKGVMSVEVAQKAVESGAAAIVVSNHGGRVIDQLPAVAEVLPSIAEAVGTKVKIIADGAVRNGIDVFKLLALGADLVLIGRPYVLATYGGGSDGVVIFTEKIGGELLDAMYMTGAININEIDIKMLYWPEMKLNI